MRIVVLIVFLVLLGLLAALNTNFLMYPHTLNLGFATYPNLPLGLLLLAVMFVPMLVFYFWVGVAKLRAEADSARLLRDMEALRVSLDTQEGSRFAQLQSHLDQRLGALGAGTPGNAELEAVHARIDTMSRDLNLQLAQIDDYLKRKLG
ncbi:LapA family protein [uncultured Deinococcus sp.]|uniref:LapA family protein n=1 Tax=uncultured Deinococcus sp. TaxID=158789 RepID=UPI003748B58E